jgi:hypothetical protein
MNIFLFQKQLISVNKFSINMLKAYNQQFICILGVDFLHTWPINNIYIAF